MNCRLYRLCGGFSVVFILRGNVLHSEWEPAEPSREEFLPLLDDYLAARGDFLATAAPGVPVIENIARGPRDAVH